MAGSSTLLRQLAPAHDVALADALAALDEARSGFGWVIQSLEFHPDEMLAAIDHAKFQQKAVIKAIADCRALVVEQPLDTGEA